MAVLLRGCGGLFLRDLSRGSGVLRGACCGVNYNGANGQRFLSGPVSASNGGTGGLSSVVMGAGINGGKEEGAIKITEKCKQRLREILDEKGTFLRISVEGGGCSGFQYKFDIDNQSSPDDIVISKEEGAAAALVVIDEMSLDIIRGSTLDYETELIRSTFRILSNPHAEQGCSCGASFNMKI